jgi:hypothetical protein
MKRAERCHDEMWDALTGKVLRADSTVTLGVTAARSASARTTGTSSCF